MAAAAIPALIKVGSMVGGSLLAKKLSGPTGQQQTAMTGTQGAQAQLGAAAPQLMAAGRATTAQGTSGIADSQNYYKKLLGDKAALNGAMAPQLQQVSDYYAGAAGNATRGLRGGSRDYALAELDRQKVGQLAMIPAMARSGAAKDLVGASAPLLEAGGQQTGQGVQAGSAAVGAGNSLFDQGTIAADRQSKTARSVGSMIYDAVSGWAGGKGKWGFGGGNSRGSTFDWGAGPGVAGF